MGVAALWPAFLAALASADIASSASIHDHVFEKSDCEEMSSPEVSGTSLLQHHRQTASLGKAVPASVPAKSPFIHMSLLQSLSEGIGTVSFPKQGAVAFPKGRRAVHNSMMAHKVQVGSRYESSLWYYVPMSVSLIVGLFIVALAYCIVVVSSRGVMEDEDLSRLLAGFPQRPRPQEFDAKSAVLANGSRRATKKASSLPDRPNPEQAPSKSELVSSPPLPAAGTAEPSSALEPEIVATPSAHIAPEATSTTPNSSTRHRILQQKEDQSEDSTHEPASSDNEAVAGSSSDNC